jgi:hypothetical protein
MKTRIFICVILSSASLLLNSQIPQGFNYQALARDASGIPIKNTLLPVQITIQSDSLGGTVFWKELHASVTTDNYGLVNVILGKGSKIAGTASTFSDIDWSVTPKFIKTEIDYGGLKNMGSSRFWSVPYALTAAELGGPLSKLQVSGETDLNDEAIFEVRNKSGNTVFAVYNEGVRVYVADGAKGLKGGFAVGGFGYDKAESQKYLVVTKDSVRIYLDTNPLTKKLKGGFAVGGYDMTKGTAVQDYLDVNSDSVRIYIDTNPDTKRPKGGFAVGGYDMTKSKPEEYFRVTRDSTRVYIKESITKGLKGGFAVGGFGDVKAITPKYLMVTTAQTNVQVNDSLKGFSITNVQGGTASDFMSINKVNYSIGHESGLKTNPNLSITKGKYNVFLGYRAGLNNVEGYGNIFMGHESGLKTFGGSYNVYLGFRAGNENINGNSNVFVGYQSGEKSTAGWNVYIGQGAGRWNSTGTRNTYVGCQAGNEDGEYGTPGMDNVFIGYRAGATNFIGNNNVYIGSYAGETNNNYSSGRVFIGYQAGRNEANGNKLYIDNSSSSTPLIYGEFNPVMTSRQLTINGKTTTNGSLNYGADVQTTDTYVVNIQGVTAYVPGLVIIFRANTANTTACTVNVNSLGAKALKMKNDQDPTTNYIEAGSIVMAVYDGTNFQMMQPAAN